MRVNLYIKIAIIILMTIPSNALAYTCWAPRPVLENFQDADLVFTGKVESIIDVGIGEMELGTPRQDISFKVEKIWSGLTKEDSRVHADVETLYEYNFVEGKSYLIFGYRLYGNRITIVGCPRVKLVADVAKDIRKLGKPLFEMSGSVSMGRESALKNKTGSADKLAIEGVEIIEGMPESPEEDLGEILIGKELKNTVEEPIEIEEKEFPEITEGEVTSEVVEPEVIQEEITEEIEIIEELEEPSFNSFDEEAPLVWDESEEIITPNSEYFPAINLPPMPPLPHLQENSSDE